MSKAGLIPVHTARTASAAIARLVLVMALALQGALPVMAAPAGAGTMVVATVLCTDDGPREVLYDLSTGEPVEQNAPARCPDCTACCLTLVMGLPAVWSVQRTGTAPQPLTGAKTATWSGPVALGYAPRGPPRLAV